MTKRYIVFERPEGSKCWTMAFKDSGLPASFMNRGMADMWVEEEHSHRRGWLHGKPNQTPMQAHIAKVELPQ